jgi:hypothetical protein
MKFRNKKKFWYGILVYSGHIKHCIEGIKRRHNILVEHNLKLAVRNRGNSRLCTYKRLKRKK